MSAQTSYGFFTVKGAAGGILDLAPIEVNAYLNGSDTGDMEFGMGVVADANAVGTKVVVPTSGANIFEGIVTNRRTNENDMDGNVVIKKGATVGVMRRGRIFGKLSADANPSFNAHVYLVVTGNDAGCFTADSNGTLAIGGRFLGTKENGCAPIEFDAMNFPAQKVGTGLTVDANGVLAVQGNG